MRGLATFVCWALFGAIAFATDLDDDLIQTSGSPSVAAGEFYGYQTAGKGPGSRAFQDARDLAEREHVPLVVVWSHESCHYCSGFIGDINDHSDDAKKWMTENRAVFAFFKATGYNGTPHDDDHAAAGPGYTSPKACLDAWNFIDSRGAAYNHYWPLVEFYYKPPTGPAIYCDDPDDSGKSFTWLKDRYAKWVKDKRIGDGNGRFAAVGGTEYDRYEADEGTTNLYVRLEREKNASALVWTNDLVAVWPENAGVTVTQQVAWVAGESARTVSVPLKLTAEFPVGKDITLTLYDHQDWKAMGVVSAACVKVETNASNPLWIGERDKDTLAWGEWTMDLDAATQKVAAVTEDKAYTLVLLAGSLWCPDCYNTDHHFLDVTNAAGEVRFTKWAQDRRVALVTVDLPSLGDATAITPTLVNRDPGIGYFDKTGAFAMISKSGLGYLSRKCADETAAAAVLARNMYLASHNTDDGGFHRPEDTKVYRTGVPIFALLRKDGSVAARFTRWADSSPADSTNWDNYIKRFDELLSIADGAHADLSEIENNHPASTTNVIASADGEAKGELCNADFRDSFRIDGAGEGTYQWVEVSGTDTDVAKVKVSFFRKDAAGKVEAVEGAEETGRLSGVVSLLHRFEKKGEYFVQVEGADITSPEFSDASTKPDNFHPYTLQTKSVLEPTEKAAEAQATPGSSNVQMRVEKDIEYRVTGIVGAVPGFKSEGGDLYRATIDGVVELTTQTSGGTVVFQIWRPGKVEFRDPKGVRVIEYAGTGIVVVVRSEGSSGSNVVSVVCDNPPVDDRFEWKDTELVWADGEFGEKSVRFPIRPNGKYNPDVSFKVRLVAGDPCPAAVSSATNVVTVSDTNLPCLERTSYDLSANLNFETALGFNAYNISNANPTISLVAKSGTVPSGLSFSYEDGQFVLSGAPSAEGTYEFKVSISEKRNGRTATTPKDFETTIRITVVDQKEKNPKLAEGRLNTSMPIYYEIGEGTNVIEGSLRFAITSTGKISAKYTGTEGASLSFAGNWLTIDESGTVSNRLEATSDPDAFLTMTMDAEGHANLVLDLPNGYSHFKGEGGSIRLVAESDWPDTTVDFTPWKGTYNVTFPYLGGTPTNVPAGTGFLSLRMESGLAAKSGLVIVAGVLPDGTPVSGSCQMLRDRMFEGERFNTAAYLPIFRRTGCSCFSAAAEIGRDGSVVWDKKTWADDRNRLWREIVYPVEGTMAMSLYRDAAWEYLTLHDVCGSYYVPGVSPYYLQTNFNYTATLFAKFAVGDASASARYGQIEFPAEKVELAIDDTSIDFAESVEGLVFGFNPQTGIFCGAARLSYNDGQKKKIVSGYYRGVLLPGWIDCNCGHTVPIRPYGSGTFYFKDIVNKKIVNRSFSVDLDK